jgi:hypothetical protein
LALYLKLCMYKLRYTIQYADTHLFNIQYNYLKSNITNVSYFQIKVEMLTKFILGHRNRLILNSFLYIHDCAVTCKSSVISLS